MSRSFPDTHFAATLRHYKIRIDTKDAREAHVDCLAEACYYEKADELDALLDALAELAAELDQAEMDGDIESQSRLRATRTQKGQQHMRILKGTRKKAERLAATL